MAIFVSYSSQDRDQAERLIERLGTLEQDVYFEPKSPLGKVWWSQVFDTIKHSDLFVFALTPHTVNSYARIMECSYAIALKKRILWVMLKKIVRLPPELSATEIADYCEENEATIQAFAEALTRLPPPEPLPIPLPMPPNWLSPLNELRQRLEAPDLTYREQRWIASNLQDFLERRETFDTAASLLKLQIEHPATDARITDELMSTLGSVDYQFFPRKRQGWPVKGLAVLIGSAALLAVLLTNALPANTSEVTATETLSSVALGASGVPNAQETLSAGGVSGSSVTQVVLISTIPPTRVPPTLASTALPTLSTKPSTPQTTPQSTQQAVVQTMANTPVNTVVNTAVKTAAPSATRAAATTVKATTATAASTGVTALPTSSALSLPYTYIGMRVNDTKDGVQVIQAGAIAQQAGIQIGDYILAVNTQPVATQAEFLAQMAQRRAVAVIILRLRRGGSVLLARLTPSVTDYLVAVATLPAH